MAVEVLGQLGVTIVAVVLGIPAGLWLDRRAERSAAQARANEIRDADERRLAEERNRTREALEQLEPVIHGHAAWFRILGAWKNLNEYYEGPLIELWMVLRSQIVPIHLSDRRLFGELATHFERCVRLDELVRIRSSFTLTGVPAQQQVTQIELEAIETRLNNMKNAEGATPEDLASRVADEINRLTLSRTLSD